MAYLVAGQDVPFSISEVDLNFYVRYGYSSGIVKNANITVNGVLYPDYVYVRARYNGNEYELSLLGSGIIGSWSSGITAGTIQLITEYDNNESETLWAAWGLSLRAVDVYTAAFTSFNSDDRALIAEALNGNDTLAGSDGDDYFIGYSGNDTIYGKEGNDSLAGASGNDTIDGGYGVDQAFYAGSRASASVVRNANGTLTVATSAEGSDTLLNVEQLRFNDGIYSFSFANPGAAVVANFNPANGWTSQDQNPRHVADVNGDGYADIVGFGYAGVLVSFGSASGTFSGAAVKISNFGQTAGWASDNQFHRELADVNGDGRADIVGFGYAGTLVSLAKADGTFDSPSTGIVNFGVNQGWATQNGFARTVGDVNGDGKADIVGFGYAGALVALGNGDGTFRPAVTAIANFGVNQGWTSDNTYHRAVADVNGDGKADIVGFGIAGTYVALSNGDGTFANAGLVLNDFGASQGWSSNDSFSRLVTDVNGDDVSDIVGFGIGGTLIAFGLGDGTFSAASSDLANFGAAQGWSSDNTYHRAVADLNNDGLSDIVGFGIAGVLVGMNQGVVI